MSFSTSEERKILGRQGFTLVELLVVIVIIAALVALALTATRSALVRSKQATCAQNMRQIGVGLRLYADENNGKFPETAHTASLDRAWIFQLEPYLGDFDELRVCPADPKRVERLEAGGTSYVLNSFVFVPMVDGFGQTIGKSLNRVSLIPEPARTILAFCCSDDVGTGPGNDHTHSDRWTSWSALLRDIAPDRHGGPSSSRTEGRGNYLFADGSVATWSAAEVKRRIENGDNIAAPPGVE